MTYLFSSLVFLRGWFFLRPLVGSAAAVAALLEAGPLNRFGLESTYYNKGLCGQR